MKLYDCAGAPSPRRVRIFLCEKGIAVPTVQVDLRHGEQFTEAFRAINPDCTVPVLELDDGTRIADAVGICVYFEAGPDGYEQIPALAARGRARVLRFFERMEAELAGRAFVCGSDHSIADITTLVTVDFAKWIKLAIPEGSVDLRRWYDQVSARPSAKA
jgi:glutathione S-transferase